MPSLRMFFSVYHVLDGFSRAFSPRRCPHGLSQRDVFLARPNRFVAQVLLDGETVTVHVKNTGRCRELLLPGARVWLTPGTTPQRKTAYDLIAVEKGARLINMDAQAPNRVFYEWAAGGGFVPGLTLLKAEQAFGDSRSTGKPGNERGLWRSKGSPWRRAAPSISPTPPPSGG